MSFPPFSPDLTETAMQCIMNRAYIDMADIKKGFAFEHWADTVSDFAQKHGIR